MILPKSFTLRNSMPENKILSLKKKGKEKQASNGEKLEIQAPWIGTLVKT